jgi:putative membrane protein
MKNFTRKLLFLGAVASGAVVVGCADRYDESGAARRSAQMARSDYERTTSSDYRRPTDSDSLGMGGGTRMSDTGVYGNEEGLGGSGMEGTGGSGPTSGGTAVGRDSSAEMKNKVGGAGAQVAPPAEVLAKLHHTNQMEVKMGELAKTNAKDKGVKEYGQKLSTDHQKADEELLAYAKKQNLTIGQPTTVPPEEMKAHAAKMSELQKSKEAGFDQKFLATMLEGHEKAILDVTAARDSVTDPELKSMLDKLLPTLRDHRDTAQKLEAKVTTGKTAM